LDRYVFIDIRDDIFMYTMRFGRITIIPRHNKLICANITPYIYHDENERASSRA